MNHDLEAARAMPREHLSLLGMRAPDRVNDRIACIEALIDAKLREYFPAGSSPPYRVDVKDIDPKELAP